MRLWLLASSVLALTLTIPAAADARGVMARPIMRPAMAVTHGNDGKPAGRPADPSRSIQARNPEQRFRPARQVFAVAGGGYGFTGYPDEYAGDYGAPETAGAEDPQLRPPQLTCFRPRLITIGRHPAHDVHLPKVVYGGPLPCGFKEANLSSRSTSSGPR